MLYLRIERNFNAQAKKQIPIINDKEKAVMDLVKIIKRIQHKKAERRRTLTAAYCLLCRAQVSLTPIEQVKQIHIKNWNEILQLAEKGEVHLIHNCRGELRVCSNSLRHIRIHIQRTKSLNLEFARY